MTVIHNRNFIFSNPSGKRVGHHVYGELLGQTVETLGKGVLLKRPIHIISSHSVVNTVYRFSIAQMITKHWKM
jgi:hypothetical protein